jgi:hypothetical protein
MTEGRKGPKVENDPKYKWTLLESRIFSTQYTNAKSRVG